MTDDHRPDPSESPHLTAHLRAQPMADGPSGPLAGVRVLDLTRALAGPYCGMLLGDLGADVIKIEAPSADMTRFTGPYLPDDDEGHFGAYFASVNRNKRGIVLELTEPDQRDTFLRLVDTADVVLENFRPGVMERFDLGYETLAARRPSLVYAAIRGFGDPRTGASPYGEWPAFDVVAQAMSGVVSITGPAGGDPVKFGPSIGDLYPATMTAFGIASALLHAQRTGEGQFLDVAMVDACMALAESAVYRYSYTGEVPGPVGNRHAQLSPFDIYPTADGQCAIAAPNNSHWPILCDAMGRPELADDERFAEPAARIEHSVEVRDLICAWTSEHTKAEIVTALGGRVPVGPVNSAADLLTDAHVEARGMLVAVDHPGSDRTPVFPNAPVRFTATPAAVHRRAPKLGEHQAEVLAELDD